MNRSTRYASPRGEKGEQGERAHGAMGAVRRGWIRPACQWPLVRVRMGRCNGRAPQAAIDRRIAHRCAWAEVRERIGCYLLGLLKCVERKTRCPLATVMASAGYTAHGMQRLLNGAVWDGKRTAWAWSSQ
jgi:hypothetical protein